MAVGTSVRWVNRNSSSRKLVSIEDLTKNVPLYQAHLLFHILTLNAHTEYLQRFNLGGATDRHTFKSRVPVVKYEDLEPEILRIANGDRSPILCAYPISEFLTSSGTSDGGQRKLMPTTRGEMARRQELYSYLMPVMNLYVPGLDQGMGLYFYFIKAETITAGGLVARPVLTSYYKSEQFRNRPVDPFNVYTSPIEAILCEDSFQSMYTQMLCGLIMRERVLRIGAVFAPGLLRAIKFLELNWRALAHDIRTGSLNPKITDDSIIRRMADILKQDLELAEFIVKACEGENWKGIIPRIWPNTIYVDVIATGTMAQYIPQLDSYSGGLPLACTMYASSECYFGLNLEPMTPPSEVTYTIMPNMGYFEFIPHGEDISPSELVDLADVEVGKEYELVVTTYSGLYRYQVGDVLRVMGYHNSAPQFKFVRRKDVLLAIDAEKTNELELQQAVANATPLLSAFDTTVVEYTSCADITSIPGHYVIYWELLEKQAARAPTDDVLAQCCLVMEESLNSVYRQCRVADNSIGPLEIRVVRGGTFDELMDYAILQGASINQYKVPRCVSCTPIVEMLDARVVSASFSPGAPHWTAERRV